MIDEFLTTLSSPWPREDATSIVRMLRRPDRVDEAIKWGNPFFSVNGHAVAKVFVARDWINVYFYRGTELADPDNLLGAKGNSAMMRLRVGRGQEAPAGIRRLMDEAVGIAARL